MEWLPDPPSVADLVRRGVPDTRVLPAGTLLWRVFHRGGSHPIAWNELRRFGPTGSRFDHHPDDGPPRTHHDRGILYATESPVTALVEFFQVKRVINRRLSRPWLVQFALTEALALADVTGSWILKLGGSAAISSGSREQSRKWSRALYEAFPTIDGICFRSSLNPEWVAFALYERAARAFPIEPLLHAPLTAPRLAPLIASATNVAGYSFT